MIQVEWAGFDLSEMEYGVIAAINEIEHDARQIVEDCVNYALEEFTRIMEAAVTNEGLARASGGGHPGRVETATMAADVRLALEGGADEAVVGTWGWVDGYKPYYIYQEYGTGEFYKGPGPIEGSDSSRPGSNAVPAMRALQTSYIKARELLRERLREMGLELT